MENPFDKWVTQPDAPVEAPVSPAEAEATGQPANPFTRLAPSPPGGQGAPVPGAINAAGDTIDPVTGRLRIRVTPSWAMKKAPGEEIQPQGPPQEDPGALKAAAIGAGQGLTFNFGDELLGSLAAGAEGMSEHQRKAAATAPLVGLPAMHVIGLARLGLEMLNDEPGPATQAYERIRNQARDATENAYAQRPVSTTLGNIGGSLATPGVAMVAPVRAAGAVAPSALRQVGTRMARGAAVGAPQGGLSGIGEGTDLADRGMKGATGTAVGGTIGAVVPAMAAPVMALGRAVVTKGRGFVRALQNPELQAERVIAGEVADTQGRLARGRGRQSGLTEAEFNAAAREGQPVVNMELAGRGGQRLGRVARNTPGANEAKDVLEATLEQRTASQGPRIGDFIHDLVYGRSGQRPVDFDRLRELARSANAPAYQRANADATVIVRANPKGLWSDELARLSRSPTIKEAMLSIGKLEGDRSIIEGFNAARKNPFVIDPKTGRLGLHQTVDANGNVTSTQKADLNAWDSVQRLIRGAESEAVVSGNLEKARRFGILRDDLVTELDRLVPSFATARGTAWRGFRAQDAYEAGENYVTMAMKGREADALRRTMRNMSQQDREVFMHGFTTRTIDMVQRIGFSQDVLKRMFNSPAAMHRIEDAIGPQRTRELEAFLHVERIMQRGNNEVNKGSTTAQQLLEGGAVGVGGNMLLGGDAFSWSSVLAGAGGAGARYGHSRATTRLADSIGELLMSGDRQAFRRGIALLATNERYMENVRNFVGQVASKGLSRQGAGVLQGETQPSQ